MALTTSVALSVHRDSAQVEPRLPSTCVEWPGTSRPAPWHQWSPSDWGWWLQPGLALTVPHPDGGRISLAPSGRSQQGLGSWLEAQFTLLGPPPDLPQRRLGSLSHLQSVFEEGAPLSQSPEAPLTLPSRQTVDHEGHSLVHGETHEAPAQAPGPLLLQGLAPQEGDGRLQLAGEGQARLQGTVVRPQVGMPVPVACGEGSPWGQCPAEVPYGRGRSPPSEPLRDLGNLGWGQTVFESLGETGAESISSPGHPSPPAPSAVSEILAPFPSLCGRSGQWAARGVGKTMAGEAGSIVGQEGSRGPDGGGGQQPLPPACLWAAHQYCLGTTRTFLDAQGVDGPVPGIHKAMLGSCCHHGLVHGHTGRPRDVQLPAQLPDKGQPHGPDL